MSDIAPLDITSNAARRIQTLLAAEATPATALRIAVDGGGCSGFQYRFAIEHTPPTSEDTLFTKDDAKVLVDETSLQFLSGSQLDYVETMAGSSFEIKNPNSTATCGCGNSFSIV